jgi:hypothetical protein
LACGIGVTGTFEVDEHFANEHAPDLLGMAMFHLEKPSLKKIIRSLKWLSDLTLLCSMLND